MNPSSTPPHVVALHRIDIPSPCTASWDAMQGNDQVRHCGLCKKNVFNLSAMPEAEAAALVASNTDGNLCVRFYRRSDGTVMTSDCGGKPSPERRPGRLLGKVAGAAGAMALAMAAHAGPGTGPGDRHAAKDTARDEGPMLMGAPPAIAQQVEVRKEPAPVATTMGEPVVPHGSAKQEEASDAAAGRFDGVQTMGRVRTAPRRF